MLYFFLKKKIAIIIVVKSKGTEQKKSQVKKIHQYAYTYFYDAILYCCCYFFQEKHMPFSISFFSSFRPCSTTFFFPLQQSFWHKKKAGLWWRSTLSIFIRDVSGSDCRAVWLTDDGLIQLYTLIQKGLHSGMGGLLGFKWLLKWYPKNFYMGLYYVYLLLIFVYNNDVFTWNFFPKITKRNSWFMIDMEVE